MGSICSCCLGDSKQEKDVRSSLVDSANSDASAGVYRSATLVVPAASSPTLAACLQQSPTRECADTTPLLSASNLSQSEEPSDKADAGVRSC